MSDFLTYPQQLDQPEWKEKRESIMQRDGHKCLRCGHSPTLFEYEGKFYGYDLDCREIDNSCITNIAFYSREEHKQKFGYSTIDVKWIRSSQETINNFGPLAITDNGLLVLVPLSIPECESLATRSDEDRRELFNRIVIISLKSGECYHVLLSREMNIDNFHLRIPFISDHRISLNVHHKYYLYSSKAWEYPDSALITLCEHCHLLVHKETSIKVYTYDANHQMIEMNYTPCLRCHGAGYFPQWNHVEHGVCFRCRGARYEELISNP